MNRRQFIQTGAVVGTAALPRPQARGTQSKRNTSGGKRIALVAAEPGGVTRTAFPLTVGIPFAPGVLAKGGSVGVVDSSGRAAPVQTRVLESHRDGSVRWLLVDYQSDFAPFGKTRNELVVGSPGLEAPAGRKITTEQQGSTLVVDNGAIKLELDRTRCRPLSRVWRAGQLVSEGGLSFWVTAEDGARYDAAADTSVSFEIEESGPLRLLARWAGSHRDSSGRRHFDFVVRLTVYAGQPFVRIDHIFINRLDPEVSRVREIGGRLPLQLPGQPSFTVGERYRPGPGQPPVWFNAREPVRLEMYRLGYFRIVNSAGKVVRDEVTPRPNPFMPNASMGWVDARGTGQAVLLTGKNFWQNYPKAIAVAPGSLDCLLVPDRDQPLAVPRGMAKTHTFFLTFHDGSARGRALIDAAFTVQRWPMPAADSEYYQESGELWDFFPYFPEKYPRLEAGFAELLDPDRSHFPRQQPSGRAYGMKHYGDFMIMAKGDKAPDPDAPNTLYLNNEYDTAHVLAMLFLRDRDVAKWWVAEAHALHMMDIDTCHHAVPVPLNSPDDPRAEADSEEGDSDQTEKIIVPPEFMIGAQYRHCAQHIVKSPRNPDHSHVFGEGLIDYYHLTGDRQAFDTAVAYGKNLAYRTNHYKHYVFGIGRGSGWSLLTMGGAYILNQDPEVAKAANAMIDRIISQQDSDGVFLDSNYHPKTWEDRKYTLCLRGLIKWHQATQDPKTRKLILAMVDAFIRLAMGREGLPRATGWPESNKPNTASQGFANLEALAYAYDLTGNRKYIDAGIAALCQAVDWIVNPKDESDHVFFHRILRGPFRFMALAHGLGLLEKVPNAGPWLRT